MGAVENHFFFFFFVPAYAGLFAVFAAGAGASSFISGTSDSNHLYRTNASCGVDRSACETDSEYMYKCESKTDDKSAEGAVLELL